jgi:GntR family transcriptional regulator
MGADHTPRAPAELTAGAGVPLHRQLFLVLSDEIARGALSPGDPLPTEQALGEQFRVSRITVRRALADLSDAGLIDRRHGVGSFVRRDAHAHAHPGGSYMDELRQTEFETEVVVLDIGVRRPPAAIGRQLGADAALQVLRLRRERRTGEPLMVTEAWLPASLADVVTEDALLAAPLYRLLADAGVTLAAVQHEITAEVAGPRNAELLGTAIGAPLLRVNRLASAAGRPHHALSILLSPNRSRVVLSQSGFDLEGDGGMSIAHDVRRP